MDNNNLNFMFIRILLLEFEFFKFLVLILCCMEFYISLLFGLIVILMYECCI